MYNVYQEKLDCFISFVHIENQNLQTKSSNNTIIVLITLPQQQDQAYSRFISSSVITVMYICKNNIYFSAINDSKYHIILSSPEAALTSYWFGVWRRLRQEICLLAIDEAHCLVQW